MPSCVEAPALIECIECGWKFSTPDRLETHLRVMHKRSRKISGGPRDEKLHPFTRAELAILSRQILDRPKRCPEGHLCQLWPCVTCEAESARREARTGVSHA